MVNHLVYDAFGNVTSETDPAVDSLFIFTARPFDQDSHLQNNLNRWYDPVVGRWLSEDPVGFNAGDENLYRYVGNAPGNSFDPIGLAVVVIRPTPRPRWWPDWLFWPYDEQGIRQCRQNFDPSDFVCPLAGFARREALKRIWGLAEQIDIHFAKLAKEPGAQAVAHWKHEISVLIRRVEEYLPCVGKRTREQIEPQVQAWKDQLRRLSE